MKQIEAARVLVASDSVEDATRISGQLEQEFADVRMSTDGNKAVEDFDAFAPDVLVVAFDSLQKAQGYALDSIDMPAVITLTATSSCAARMKSGLHSMPAGREHLTTTCFIGPTPTTASV
jgi:CheY-like chemotaxis protein